MCIFLLFSPFFFFSVVLSLFFAFLFNFVQFFFTFLSCSVSGLFPSGATIKEFVVMVTAGMKLTHCVSGMIPVNSQPLIRLTLITLKATWLSLDFSPSISEFRWSQKSRMQKYIYFHNRPEHYLNNGLDSIYNLLNNLGTDCIFKYVKLSSTYKYFLLIDEIFLHCFQKEWTCK